MSKSKDPTVFRKRTGHVDFGRRGSFWSVTGRGIRISAIVGRNSYDKKDSVDILWSKNAKKLASGLGKASSFIQEHSADCSFIVERL